MGRRYIALDADTALNNNLTLYVTAQMCRRTEEVVVTYGRGPNAIDISQGSLTCPSDTDTGPTFLFGDSDTTPL